MGRWNLTESKPPPQFGEPFCVFVVAPEPVDILHVVLVRHAGEGLVNPVVGFFEISLQFALLGLVGCHNSSSF